MESPKYQFVGIHFVASYMDCDHASLTNLEKLKQAMTTAVQASGATILNMVDFVFDPDGYTAAYVLSESHATIHTYPEFNSCFIDLFTCGNNCSHERFDKSLREYLIPERVNAKVISRDGDNL